MGAVLLRVAVVFALVWSTPAAAVIIASGDGTGNTSTPADDPGWDNVGVLGIYTGVYVGNGWVLTADHVGEQDVTFDGTTHRAVPGSGIQLTTDVIYGADLLLFRIETDPHLSSPPVIAGSPPPYAGELLMIGQGRNRDPNQTWWKVEQGVWTEVPENDPNVAYSGFKWSGGRALRWGTNKVLGRSQRLTGPYGRVTWSFWTNFTESGGTDHEAQAAGGDSGGAVFATGSGELTGIMWTRNLYNGQPSETAIYGNATYAAQISEYSDQILSITAEPACDNGVDDDGDGFCDTTTGTCTDGSTPGDAGCDDSDDAFETSDALPCDDGFDNDGDGRIDFDPTTYAAPGDETTPPSGQGDPGCHDPSWGSETPRCQDGIDNDGDGMMDYDAGLFANGVADPAGPDPECVGDPSRNSEAATLHSCGLGAELALLLPPLLWMRRCRESANPRFRPRWIASRRRE